MNPKIDYSTVNNVLRIKSSGVDVSFQWPIAEVVAYDDILVVRVDPDPGTCFNENVFGIAEDGNIVWTIKKRKHVYDDSPYTTIVAKDGNVKLFNWDGDELLVEPKSGKVISVGYGKQLVVPDKTNSINPELAQRLEAYRSHDKTLVWRVGAGNTI